MENIKEQIEALRIEFNEKCDAILNSIPPEPEFKVGLWAAWKNIGSPKRLFLITKFVKSNGVTAVFGKDFRNNDKEVNQCDYGSLISVTSEEIKENLKNICDKRYIGKKARSLTYNRVFEIIKIWNEYDTELDRIQYMTTAAGWVCTVYQKGVFAEIISDKKKLPKTKEEAAKFLTDYYASGNMHNFLDQYED